MNLNRSKGYSLVWESVSGEWKRERKLQSMRNQGEGTIPLTHPVVEQRNRHSHFDSLFPSIEDRGFPRWVAIYSPDREGRINPIKGDT